MSGQEDPHGDEREEGMSACGCDAPIVKAPSDDDAVEHVLAALPAAAQAAAAAIGSAAPAEAKDALELQP